MCEYLEEARYISIAEARVIGSPFMMKMEQVRMVLIMIINIAEIGYNEDL